MRWRYYNPNDPAEAGHHDATLQLIESWWHQFQLKTPALSALFKQQRKWDLPRWMDDTLHRIDSNLCWEYGPAVHCDGHRLVITPESNHHLRPLVATILQRAPQVDGWEFYAYRLPEDLEQTVATVKGRTTGDISQTLVRVSIGKHHRVDLCYCSPDCSSSDDQQANNNAFVATETLLGEELLDKWVGIIDVAPLSDTAGTAGLIPLDRLQPTVMAVIDSIRDQMPDTPWHLVSEPRWTMYELHPEEADDYPNQFDMFVGGSAYPEMWVAAHCGLLFSSDRFSRHGETYCYVKLDGSGRLDEERFADKSEIEEALDTILKSQGLGCHIGGGTGLRYSYIDLALTDLPGGIETVRRRLAEGNVPKRSWIQFFDSDLSAEWVGIYDDSPEPPM